MSNVVVKLPQVTASQPERLADALFDQIKRYIGKRAKDWVAIKSMEFEAVVKLDAEVGRQQERADRLEKEVRALEKELKILAQRLSLLESGH